MNIVLNGENTSLPDFIIIGASRSGTSALYYHLREHQEIFMPEQKEPHFFNYIETWALEDYIKLFEAATYVQVIGEATASYLYYFEESIKNIKLIYGSKYRKLKLIAILRNPIERAWSYYMLMRRIGHNKDFFETIQQNRESKDQIVYDDFIKSGMYYKQVEAFYENFSLVKVFLFDEFIQNPGQVLRQIFSFLNLEDCEFLPKNLKTVYNPSGVPKKKIYAPIYNFLFRSNSSLKRLLKPIIPFSVRQTVQTYIANRILKKTEYAK